MLFRKGKLTIRFFGKNRLESNPFTRRARLFGTTQAEENTASLENRMSEQRTRHEDRLTSHREKASRHFLRFFSCGLVLGLDRVFSCIRVFVQVCNCAFLRLFICSFVHVCTCICA
jgi:hypothetical protein